MREVAVREVNEFVVSDRRDDYVVDRLRELDERDENIKRLDYLLAAVERISKRLDEMVLESARLKQERAEKRRRRKRSRR